MVPPRADPLALVYSIISSPIRIKPTLVVPTPTPSKVPKLTVLSTEI